MVQFSFNEWLADMTEGCPGFTIIDEIVMQLRDGVSADELAHDLLSEMDPRCMRMLPEMTAFIRGIEYTVMKPNSLEIRR